MNFNDFDISEKIKRAISEMGITQTTPIQEKAIFPALNGEDVLAEAPTGTGKTFAFGIPLLENTDRDSDEVQGIILCPTRELAIQVANELRGLLKFEEGIRVLPVYGGENIERQITALRKKPQIIAATPGRLNDHIKRKKISLSNVKTIVLDEADEMLSMGFLPDIDIILGKTPFDAQKLMFSATMPEEILNISKKFSRGNTVRIKISSPKKELSPQISQYYLEMKHSMKTDVLKSMIDVNKYKLCLVFCNTKKKVDELCASLSESGYLVSALHGDMKQQDRDRVMYKFRNDKINILVATDVAARGVDVDGIDAVFNYDIPLQDEHYVHRIGRTGRAEKSGVAYTFLSNREMYRLKEIMEYTKTKILPLKRPSLEEAELSRAEEVFKTVKKIAETEDLSRYKEKISEFSKDGTDELTVAAALLYMKLKPQKSAKEEKKNSEKTEKQGKAKERKNSKNGEARLFFNVGSLDKIRPRHLEELINSHPMLCGIRIKEVDIYDKFSFMNVEAKDANDICDALTGMKFKGRELYVEVAETKKKPEKQKKTRKK